MPELFCHNCGTMFIHRPGADLYCSNACAEQYEKRHEEAKGQLQQAGFMQHADSNYFVKDGIGFTPRDVLREGLTHVLAVHSELVAKRVEAAAQPAS